MNSLHRDTSSSAAYGSPQTTGCNDLEKRTAAAESRLLSMETRRRNRDDLERSKSSNCLLRQQNNNLVEVSDESSLT